MVELGPEARRADLARALAAVLDGAAEGLATIAELLELPEVPSAATHADLFSFQVYPYASVFLGAEGQLGGEARDRIAGFLRALQVTPPPEPDHLVVLLHVLADLAELDDGHESSRARHALRVLLHEHLLTWAPRFLARVAELGGPAHERWAGLVHALLDAEVERLGAPTELPAPLATAPAMSDPAEVPLDAFLSELLAPARSGIVLARADVAAAARSLGLGLRMGERSYMLRSLLQQDAAATFAWLAGEARRQQEQVGGGGVIDRFWTQRLVASAAVLDRLAGEARAASDT